MLQKFALAFKSRTSELFSDRYDALPSSSKDGELAFDGLYLLDSADEFITDQKVVVLKPDSFSLSSADSTPTKKQSSSGAEIDENLITAQVARTLLSSLFATLASFKASYLQFQSAHDPFDEDAVKIADRALISHLTKLSDLKQFVRNFSARVDFNVESVVGSSMESQVQENQSVLRTLEIVVNRLQSEIDAKDTEVLVLKQKLEKIRRSNLELSMKLSDSSKPSNRGSFSISFFSSVLHNTRRSVHRFTKLLIELIKRAGWDFELVARSVHSDIEFHERKHTKYALLSFVCLGIFEGFDLPILGVEDRGKDVKLGQEETLKLVAEHISVGPMETLERNPDGEFSVFCQKKYQQIINSTMESSIFTNLEGSEVVLSSWKSLGIFNGAFVKMASSVWMLHKLAYSFDPPVKTFQVEKGTAYSEVGMEDVTWRGKHNIGEDNDQWTVGFTVIPGFKIGKTLVQSQIYLTRSS